MATNPDAVMGGLRQPSLPTVKRLYAVSGNQCAFPGCRLPLVDPTSGTVTGRICHIKARSPGGPRYDPAQSDGERHGFANLIILCPIHHDVIDADEASYTVERLTEIKAGHEASNVVDPPSRMPDGAAAEMVANIDAGRARVAVVMSDEQTGGQTAQYIINLGHPWQPDPAARQAGQRAEVDRRLFEAFLNVLPSTGSIRFVKEHHMGGAFRNERLDQVDEFYETWGDPEHEFLDVEIEVARRNLYQAVAAYREAIALHCHHDGWGVLCVPSDRELDHPDRYHATIEGLHGLARAVVAAHADLVRTGRRKLGV
ncbi:MAG: endonuclease [Phycisphaerales bacterium]|nr:endonuclease [Phycisphaerales bacterium]